MTTKSKDISFYFFDLDDNMLFLKTPIFLRDTTNDDVKEISTTEFAEIRSLLGKSGDWKDFEIYDGTYSHFSDIPDDDRKPGQKQYLVEDIGEAIAGAAETWQAPSWSLFVYACMKQRPLSIVTARGHTRETVKAGIRVLLDNGLIDKEPNYLTIYAVGNPDIAAELVASLREGEEKRRVSGLKDPTSALKRIAIRNTVEKALDEYGSEPDHRFGMSDDDPMNVDLIIKAMCDCKKKYIDKRFFVISTHEGEKVKLEVFPVDYPVTGKAERDEEVG